MTVQGIINMLQKSNPDWTSPMLLDLLNSFVEMVLKIDTVENLVFDPTTGRLPYLETSQGVFSYTLPSTYYKCKYILEHEGHSGYPNNLAFQAHHSHYAFNTVSIELGAHRYRQVPVVLQPQFGTGSVTVLFQFDPQNTTNTYHVYAYQAGNSIVSINSTLQIESKFHLSHVIPACQMLIDGLDNGNFQDIMPVVNTMFVEPIQIQKYWNSQPDSNVEALGL